MRWHLVTGASSGIGQAIATALLDQGECVVGVQRTAGMYPENHPRYKWVPCDFSSRASLIHAASMVVKYCTSFDSFVFCAGYQNRDEDQWLVPNWDKYLQVNALGQIQFFEILEKAGKVAPNASVLYVSSYLARSGSDWCPAYSASKVVFENYWASKLKCENSLRVNFLLPGRVETSSNPVRPGVVHKPVGSVIPHALYLIDNEDVRSQTLDAGKD